MKDLLRNAGVILPSIVLLGGCSGADSTEDPSAISSVSEKASFPSGNGCTSSQQSTIRSDETLAQAYLDAIGNQAFNVLFNTTPNSTQRLNQNFRPGPIENYFVFNTYNAIRFNLSSTGYFCRSATHSDCTGDFSTAYARTDKASSQVRLCPSYFMLARVSRARVLIHEASHQNRNSESGVGTDDGYTPEEYQFPSVHNAFGYEFYSNLCYDGLCWP